MNPICFLQCSITLVLAQSSPESQRRNSFPKKSESSLARQLICSSEKWTWLLEKTYPPRVLFWIARANCPFSGKKHLQVVESSPFQVRCSSSETWQPTLSCVYRNSRKLETFSMFLSFCYYIRNYRFDADMQAPCMSGGESSSRRLFSMLCLRKGETGRKSTFTSLGSSEASEGLWLGGLGRFLWLWRCASLSLRLLRASWKKVGAGLLMPSLKFLRLPKMMRSDSLLQQSSKSFLDMPVQCYFYIASSCSSSNTTMQFSLSTSSQISSSSSKTTISLLGNSVMPLQVISINGSFGLQIEISEYHELLVGYGLIYQIQLKRSDDGLLSAILLLIWQRERIPYEFVEDFELSTGEGGIVTVVSGQQTAMKGKPLLTETLLNQLSQSLKDTDEVSLQQRH